MTQISIRFSYSVFKDFLYSAIPFGVSTIFSNFIYRSGIFLLPLIHDTYWAGIFHNGQIFLFTLFFIPNTLARVLTPFLYKYPFKENKDKFQFAFDSYSKILMIGGFFLFLIFFAFSEDIIVFIYGSKYILTASVLRIVSFGIVFSFTISGTIITTLDKQEIRTKYDGYTVVITIILNIILIKYFKANGAALASAFTQLLLFIFYHYYLVRNSIVKVKRVLFVFIKLTIISILIIFIKLYFFPEMFFLFSIVVLAIIYLIIVFFFLITKDDIRIVKEIILK